MKSMKSPLVHLLSSLILSRSTLNEEDIKELIWRESLNFNQNKMPK
ncbi:hypothetical protein Goari_002926 [Gossypium aridum]|uniref:Uncharacterized protein n=1 Tax=Gossypium aridum TaxID=34290 RepID=A0A7J8YAC1_GOSAI|nr:hypothetical protein [Gossypium aridum]